MKANWDDENKKLIIDLEWAEVKGNFGNGIISDSIIITHGVFVNTNTEKPPFKFDVKTKNCTITSILESTDKRE